MRVAVHGRLRNGADKERFEEVLAAIVREFETVAFSEELLAILPANDLTALSQEELRRGAFDMLISVGGDGTILESVRKVGGSGTPILGVNVGRLGFLASTPFENCQSAFKAILEGRFVVEDRTLVRAETSMRLFGNDNFALNEISVHKSATSSMLVVHAYLDDFFLNTYWADGLIVSTPTGSTGYSLSAGGPIVVPSTNTLVLTPIAPHNLNVRPLVVSSNRKIRLKVEATEPNFLISLDSQSQIVATNVEISISEAPFTVGLVRFGDQDYFETLRNKLMWGIDRRN
jgi:NAD+ kinase